MKIFFLGDIVGKSGRLTVIRNLKDIVKKNKIDFVVVNGENAADQGVGITEVISNDLFNSGVDVITTGNHVWDQKETANHIERETRLLRPENLTNNSPGNGFGIYKSQILFLENCLICFLVLKVLFLFLYGLKFLFDPIRGFLL